MVWEDTYFEPLAEILGHVVRKLTPSTDVPRPSVLNHTARSNSAFERYVNTTWPKVSPRGLPMNPGPIDHVICVIDADKISDLFPQGVPHPPNDSTKVTSWHIAAEQAWHSRLRSKSPEAGPPASSVHGVVLRWSKESVLLSGYDQQAFAQHLGCDVASPEIGQLLKKCDPVPHEVEGNRFSDSYRRPLQCLKVLRTAAKLATLPKNAPEIDDALRKLGRESLGKLCERAPDIPRIAELIWKLHMTVPAAPEPITEGSSKGGAAPRPRSRTRGKKSAGWNDACHR